MFKWLLLVVLVVYCFLLWFCTSFKLFFTSFNANINRLIGKQHKNIRWKSKNLRQKSRIGCRNSYKSWKCIELIQIANLALEIVGFWVFNYEIGVKNHEFVWQLQFSTRTRIFGVSIAHPPEETNQKQKSSISTLATVTNIMNCLANYLNFLLRRMQAIICKRRQIPDAKFVIFDANFIIFDMTFVFRDCCDSRRHIIYFRCQILDFRRASRDLLRFPTPN